MSSLGALVCAIMEPRAKGLALAAALLLPVGCKTDDRIHVDCTQVCAHYVEVRTRDCIYNCVDRRAAAKADCLNGDCPSWTPEQTDCVMQAQDIAAIGRCAYRR